MVSKSGEIRALKVIFSLASRKETPRFEQRLETNPACVPCFFRLELVSGSLELESLAITETNCMGHTKIPSEDQGSFAGVSAPRAWACGSSLGPWGLFYIH